MADFAKARVMMVDTQVRPNDVTFYPVIESMLATPREAFLPEKFRDVAYVGDNIQLAAGRVALEPRSLAKMIETLDPGPKDLVLDLGCGTGYATALLARLSQAVVGLEENAELAAFASHALGAQAVDNAAILEATLSEGCPAQAPYDRILISGGAVSRISDAIADQLAEGGRIVAIFAQGHLGVVRLGTKVDGRIDWRDVFNASAPLLSGFEPRAEFQL